MSALARFRSAFEPILQEAVESDVSGSKALVQDPFLADAVAHAGRLTLAGGKRVRPYIADLMYRGLGGRKLKAARERFVTLELFHVFGLVHDDIIDRGLERHGVPTVHRQVAATLKKAIRTGDLDRVGESQALLVGDLVFAWVCRRMSGDAPFSAKVATRMRDRFYRMVEEVVVGQMVDVDLTTRTSATSALIDDKMRLKTASYTFVRPMQIGAALADGSAKDDRFCEAFGLALGLAFQIQDDLLDLTATAEVSGKTPLRDLAERQHTVFTQWIAENGSAAHRKELKALFGQDLRAKDQLRVVALFKDSGAIDYGKSLIDGYLTQAVTAVRASRYPEPMKAELLELVGLVKGRSK
jgi:geranylgeranyl diphosphate synthase type I